MGSRAIAEGIALISGTLSQGVDRRVQLQAAIAAVHDEAARAEDTDWPQILALYGLLKRMSDNPMVTLNHAIAAAMVHGAAGGLSCSKRWTTTSAWPATIASTPCARTARDGRRQPSGGHRTLPNGRRPRRRAFPSRSI